MHDAFGRLPLGQNLYQLAAPQLFVRGNRRQQGDAAAAHRRFGQHDEVVA